MSWTTIYEGIPKRQGHFRKKTIAQMLDFIIRPQLPKLIIAFTSLFKFLSQTGVYQMVQLPCRARTLTFSKFVAKRKSEGLWYLRSNDAIITWSIQLTCQDI